MAGIWIIPQNLRTSYQSAPELEGSTLDSESLSQLCASSLTRRGKDQPPRSWLRLLKRERWMQLLSGRIYEPSRASRFVDAYAASLAVIPVREKALLASSAEPRTPAGSGHPLPEWSPSCAPTGVSLRTSRTTPIRDSASSDLSWKKWVTALRRVYSARRKSARLTGGSGCSSSQWPTTAAADSERGSKTYKRGNLTLRGAALQWPTPTQPYGSNQGGAMGREDQPNRPSLQTMAPQWSTPHSNCTTGPGTQGREGGLNLQTQVAVWTTPQVHDAQGPGEAARHGRFGTKHGGRNLNDQAALGRQAPRILTAGDGSLLPDEWTSSRLYLNPRFVCWLMGWPVEWTNSAPEEMGSWLFRQRTLLQSLLDDSEANSEDSAMSTKAADKPDSSPKVRTVQINALIHRALSAIAQSTRSAETPRDRMTIRDLIELAVLSAYPEIKTSVEGVITDPVIDPDADGSVWRSVTRAAWDLEFREMVRGSVIGTYGQEIKLDVLAGYVGGSAEALGSLREAIISFEKAGRYVRRNPLLQLPSENQS